MLEEKPSSPGNQVNTRESTQSWRCALLKRLMPDQGGEAWGVTSAGHNAVLIGAFAKSSFIGGLGVKACLGQLGQRVGGEHSVSIHKLKGNSWP